MTQSPASNRPSEEPLAIIAIGTVSPVYAIDSHFVLKRRPNPSNDFARQAYDIEVRAYQRLGNHPRIAKLHQVTDRGLVLERGDCLRRRLQTPGYTTSVQTRLRWAREAAEGLRYIHSKGIIHADVGCHNLLLDGEGHVRVIDFAGSGIDKEAAMVCYEWCSYRPGSEPDIGTDIFAVGSMLFEIESGRKPYCELEKMLDVGMLTRRVEHLFAMGMYPGVDTLVLGEVILHCWKGEYRSMDDVVEGIDACCQGIQANSVPSFR